MALSQISHRTRELQDSLQHKLSCQRIKLHLDGEPSLLLHQTTTCRKSFLLSIEDKHLLTASADENVCPKTCDLRFK